MTPVTTHFFDMPDLSNDDLDNEPMTWDAIVTYALITLSAMLALVVALGVVAWFAGLL